VLVYGYARVCGCGCLCSCERPLALAELWNYCLRDLMVKCSEDAPGMSQCADMHKHSLTHTHTRMRTHTHTHACAHTHTHTHARTHTHTRTCTHTHCHTHLAHSPCTPRAQLPNGEDAKRQWQQHRLLDERHSCGVLHHPLLAHGTRSIYTD
jgi:hypothetical protein